MSSQYSNFKILVIIFVVGACYFGIGSYVNKSKYELSGVESLPNYLFWQDFPYLINDGFRFTIQ